MKEGSERERAESETNLVSSTRRADVSWVFREGDLDG